MTSHVRAPIPLAAPVTKHIDGVFILSGTFTRLFAEHIPCYYETVDADGHAAVRRHLEEHFGNFLFTRAAPDGGDNVALKFVRTIENAECRRCAQLALTLSKHVACVEIAE